MYSEQCTLYSVHCTVYNVQYTQYSVQFYIVHCTLCIVQSMGMPKCVRAIRACIFVYRITCERMPVFIRVRASVCARACVCCRARSYMRTSVRVRTHVRTYARTHLGYHCRSSNFHGKGIIWLAEAVIYFIYAMMIDL